MTSSRSLSDVGQPTRSAGAGSHADDKWFWDQYDSAAGEVVDFLTGANVPLEGKRIADVGCGSGITDLGIFHKARPESLVGFDINPVDIGGLRTKLAAQGLDPEVPAGLEFRTSAPCRLPADDDAFHIAVTWSAFEHIRDPVCVLEEIHRVTIPDGVLMLQLWPFYHSEHGSHLWDWFPQGWVHLTRSIESVTREVRASDRHGHEWTEVMLSEFQTLNRITLDQLGRYLTQAGWRVIKLEPMAHTIEPPAELAHWPLSLLAIAGVKLLAVHA